MNTNVMNAETNDARRLMPRGSEAYFGRLITVWLFLLHRKFCSTKCMGMWQLEGLKTLKKIDCCDNCHERLTFEELGEAVDNGLKLGEVCCNDFYQDFMKEKVEEERNPDERR